MKKRKLDLQGIMGLINSGLTGSMEQDVMLTKMAGKADMTCLSTSLF